MFGQPTTTCPWRVSFEAGTMKQKQLGLLPRYVAALGKYLKQGHHAKLQPALKLGRQAVALGVEILELARIHERALVALDLSKASQALIKRAELFFDEAIVAIVETHRAWQQSERNLIRLSRKLGRRTAEMAGTKRQLQRGTVRRKSAETALKTNGEHYAGLLKVSLQLQEGLRRLAHKSFAAQEQERKTISHQLQDEIGQTLLAINVRLLTLKSAARGNTAKLAKEIVSTQQLVEASVQSVNRYARELNLDHV